MAKKRIRRQLVSSQDVRQLRESFGESQQQFAVRMGVTTRTISNWENDRPPGGATAKHVLKLIEESQAPRPEG